MKKRLLSLALAICMTAALLPTFALSATALEVNETISYYFYKSGTINSDITNLADAKNYNEEVDRYWKLNKQSNVGTSALKTTRINGATKGKNAYIALDIYVPEDGTYNAEYSYSKVYSQKSYGSMGEVYILPEGTSLSNLNTAKEAGPLIASVDYSPKDSSEAHVYEATPVNNIELKKGNNILLFVVTGLGANSTDNYWTTPTSLTLTLTAKTPTAEETLANAFKPDSNVAANDYNEPAVISITKDGSEIKSVKNSDGTHNITAPETNKAGAKFLYWAKGLSAQKRILIGKTNVLTNYVPDSEYANYLIPVYENEVSGTEFYNANGQLLPDATMNDRPYMAGYGESSGWNKYGDTNIYVAEYNNKTQPDDVDVTVVNGSGTAKVPYGEPVTCKADDTKGTFQWWEKDVNGTSEIVSINKEYSFLAYEDCTVTAVYGTAVTAPANPAKIIIDTFGENSIMAEFIGITNAVEKGIMLGTQKIAMTAPGNQFTVTADKNGTYKGYAIVGNVDDGYTLITDGEAVISGLAE